MFYSAKNLKKFNMDNPTFRRSLWEFAKGIFHRWYYWVFALLLDPADIWGRYIKHMLPQEKQFDLDVPPMIGWTMIVVLILWAAACAYHEERMRRWKYESVRLRIALCKRALESAIPEVWKEKNEYGELVPDISEDDREKIHQWALRIEEDFCDVGEFAGIVEKLDVTPRQNEYVFADWLKRKLRDYTKSLRN